MTLIIGAVTDEYAILASDRRLTARSPNSPDEVRVYDDDTCKLVALTGLAGIGYTGPAFLAGRPTHEWIAITLASSACMQPFQAAKALTDGANKDMHTVDALIRRAAFLMVGWDFFGQPPTLRPHICMITNMHDADGNLLREPTAAFESRVYPLHPDEVFFMLAVGAAIHQERVNELTRNFKRLVAHDIGPREALRLLMEEIIHCASNPIVGKKILGLCIPRRAADAFVATGEAYLYAALPTETDACFAYFEQGYSELKQYGPTIAHGRVATTAVETTNDPESHTQTSGMRFLRI